MADVQQIQPLLRFAVENLSGDLSLQSLSRRAGWSPFHLHRIFTAATRETPKQFTSRLRLSYAAALLLSSDLPVLEIALASGFDSHEVFTRAFQRQFGRSPRAYRARGLEGNAETHAAWVNEIAPCAGLYGWTGPRTRRNEMAYTVTKRVLEPQPVLTVRRKVARSDIAMTIGTVLPSIFAYAQKAGIALAGHPLTRYYEMSQGMVTLEPSMRIVAPTDQKGEGDVCVGMLPGGPAAVTVHVGPYEQLPDAYAAIEKWMAAEGLTPASAPWESYVTDPGQVPDPKDWKTEVFWPVNE